MCLNVSGGRVRDILYNKYPFLERDIKKINSIKLHIKVHKEGGRNKYEMHLALDSPGGIFTADHAAIAAEWNPVATAHSLIEKIRAQIQHKFRLN